MVYGLLVYGLWFIGLWFMVYVLLVYGLLVYGLWGITHWHIPQHTVIILCVGMHFQNAATEIATVTMLSRLQMCNTGPVVVIKHNARPLPHNSTPDMLTGGPPQCTLNSLNSLNNQRTAKPGSKIRSFSVSIPLPS